MTQRTLRGTNLKKLEGAAFQEILAYQDSLKEVIKNDSIF